MTHGRREVVRLLDSVAATPSRALGQNFVVDPNTVRRIAGLAGVGPGDRIVEVGAGLGSLTLALVEAGAVVTAIEADGRLVEALRTVVADLPVRVVHADVTALDWTTVIEGSGWHLVANLPYNIAAGLIVDTLVEVAAVDRLFVMVQAEVADRLAAPLGTRAAGITTVKVAFHANARVVGRVPPTVFHPQPRVDSALVSIVRRPPPDAPRDRLFALAEAGFGQRRKMLRSSLASLLTVDAIAASGIDPTLRAEALTLDDWCRLARAGEGKAPT